MRKIHDHLDKRCPRLGGTVTFGYCRLYGGDDLPCWKVFDCWWETFDIVEFMQSLLTAEQFDQLRTTTPKPKVASLVELINQAKMRTNPERQ